MCQIDLPEEERRRLLEEREEDLFATILVLTTAPTKVDKSNLDSSLMTSVPRRPLIVHIPNHSPICSHLYRDTNGRVVRYMNTDVVFEDILGFDLPFE